MGKKSKPDPRGPESRRIWTISKPKGGKPGKPAR